MAEKQYKGIDLFRMAAALMVIGIHTAPFSVWSDGLDFMITYCCFRVAVPFFFMVTGFFVIGPYVESNFQKTALIQKFYRKTILLYSGAVLLYLPVNIYSGNLPENLGNFFKMLLFDGTFYHLWYFPAAMIGTGILIILSKQSLKLAGWFAAISYVIGVFGDSWYGVSEKIPVLDFLYSRIFAFSSYTRNGIFFAPLFLFLGLFARKRQIPQKICKVCLLISMLLMLLEGFLTYCLNLQRHNSMYLCLPFVMFFLFQLLLEVKGTVARWIRGCSAWIYVIHPGVLIVVRGFAQVIGLKKWLIENTFLEFLSVCMVSFLIARFFQILTGYLQKRWKEKCIRKTEHGLK